MVRARKRPTGDLDRLRELLNGDGLILPPIPCELGTRLRELGPWHFATRMCRPITLTISSTGYTTGCDHDVEIS